MTSVIPTGRRALSFDRWDAKRKARGHMPAWEKVLARFTGPFHMRLIVQPIAAISLGIRDGLRDARDGEPPYLLALIGDRRLRREKISSLWASLRLGLIVAVVLDAVVQYLLFRSINVVGAILVGAILMALPYSLARGLANRAATRRRRNKPALSRLEGDRGA
jgi:hypothetical protein